MTGVITFIDTVIVVLIICLAAMLFGFNLMSSLVVNAMHNQAKI